MTQTLSVSAAPRTRLKISLLPSLMSTREVLAAGGLGLLSAASFPPLNLWPLAVLAIALWLLLLRDCPADKARVLGLIYGFVYGLGTLYWFFEIFSVLAISLVALFAAYFWMLATLIALTRGQALWCRALLVALFAVAIDWLRGDAWYLRFPWYTVPHALASSPAWIAATRWLGVYGLTYVVWLIAALGAFGKVRYWLAFALLPAAALLLPLPDAPDQRALIIQGEETHRIEDCIRRLSDEPVDLAVLPEYAYTVPVTSALKSHHGPTTLSRKTSSPVVFGAVQGDVGERNYENVAAVIDPSGALLGTFTKQRPIPLFRDGAPGRDRPVFPLAGAVSPPAVLGVALCFDFDTPHVAADLVRQGATVLVDPSFDKKEWGKNQHDHHELLLRLRAVENARWIVRAASSGRSEALDPRGYPSSEGIEYGETGSVVVGYRHCDGFALGGQLWWLGRAAAVGNGIFLIVAARRYLALTNFSSRPADRRQFLDPENRLTSPHT